MSDGYGTVDPAEDARLVRAAFLGGGVLLSLVFGAYALAGHMVDRIRPLLRRRR